VILSLKGTHNVELLIQGKKKVIVNVDRIKPYQIPDPPPGPKTDPENNIKEQPTQSAVYEFDGEKFVPHQDDMEVKADAETPTRETPEEPIRTPISEPAQIQIETRKWGKPRKIDPESLKVPPKKNKWNMEAPRPSTNKMVTHSQAGKIPEEIVSAINTSIPCFCGNQNLLTYHSKNCKQQVYNWVSTGEPTLKTTGLTNQNP
jgi:hypothetical protein